MNRETLLLNYFDAMGAKLGPSNWWPGETPFEVAVGAVLTQNTNWQNASRAIVNLKSQDLLHPEKMFFLSEDRLGELIRPAGYFRVKARRLKNLLGFLNNECRFNFSKLRDMDLEKLRARLLNVKGIGPETADSIMLYALNRPSFVVDAYTQRIFNRHGLIQEDIGYHELRDFFMSALPQNPDLYNEYHALIVRTAKQWCRKTSPRCGDCPLGPFLQ